MNRAGAASKPGIVRGRPRFDRSPVGTRAQGGSAFIELSLVVVTLFVLLAGTVELTFLLLDYHALTKSVRNAAGFWTTNALRSATTEQIRPYQAASGAAYGGQTLGALVEALVRCQDVDCGDAPEDSPRFPGLAVTSIACKDHDGLRYVVVDASHVHDFLLVPDILGSSITLSASTLMRVPNLAGESRPLQTCAGS